MHARCNRDLWGACPGGLCHPYAFFRRRWVRSFFLGLSCTRPSGDATHVNKALGLRRGLLICPRWGGSVCAGIHVRLWIFLRPRKTVVRVSTVSSCGFLRLILWITGAILCHADECNISCCRCYRGHYRPVPYSGISPGTHFRTRSKWNFLRGVWFHPTLGRPR